MSVKNSKNPKLRKNYEFFLISIFLTQLFFKLQLSQTTDSG